MIVAAITFAAFLAAMVTRFRIGIVIAAVVSVIIFLDCAGFLPKPSWEDRVPICWSQAKGAEVLVAVPDGMCGR
jgi:hypothetical protein